MVVANEAAEDVLVLESNDKLNCSQLGKKVYNSILLSTSHDFQVTCPNGDMPGNPCREPRPNCCAT